MFFSIDDGALIGKRQNEILRIEAWGKNSLRVRATKYPDFTGRLWALAEPVCDTSGDVSIEINGGHSAKIRNGLISAEINGAGVVTFYSGKKRILREYYRSYYGTENRESRCLKIVNRDFKPIIGGDYRLSVKFESGDEKIFGMGQYQQPQLNLKGCVLELAQRNSQVSVPFAVSSLGYGFLWNNPAVGRASFGMNYTEWQAEASKEMDYWITAGDKPSEIIENYTSVTGRAPVMPDDLYGLWQCKLRYRTQAEVLEVARKYKSIGVTPDVLVIDFFHWTRQGDWRFDPEYWPDPKAMCDELHSMGIKVMVSVWPTVDRKSENFYELFERGYLIRTERGSIQTYDFEGDCLEIDATNPGARRYIWEKCRKNYLDYGIDMFWLDNAEPDLAVYDFDNYRYSLGCALEVSNIYPQLFARAFCDGLKEAGRGDTVHLIRSAWAGSQRYSSLVWSGDVPSTFEAFRDQLSAGLNMGLAGIPWWTTDIGGFMTDDVGDPDFIELLLRWFEFAVFTPVLRMHGDRGPHNIPPLSDKSYGGGRLFTGQPNELWSYGEAAYSVMRAQYELRLSLKEYIGKLMRQASEDGSPLMRTLFYEFPDDPRCWTVDDEFMFGSEYLVAPVLRLGERERDVYLPAGRWQSINGGEVYEGMTTVTAPAPIEYIPVFRRL